MAVSKPSIWMIAAMDIHPRIILLDLVHGETVAMNGNVLDPSCAALDMRGPWRRLTSLFRRIQK